MLQLKGQDRQRVCAVLSSSVFYFLRVMLILKLFGRITGITNAEVNLETLW